MHKYAKNSNKSKQATQQQAAQTFLAKVQGQQQEQLCWFPVVVCCYLAWTNDMMTVLLQSYRKRKQHLNTTLPNPSCGTAYNLSCQEF